MKKKIPIPVQEILQENIDLKISRNDLYNKTSPSLNIDDAKTLNNNAISWSDQYTENIKRIADIYLSLGDKKMYDLYLKLYEGRKVFNEAHYSNRFNSIEDQIKKYEEAELIGYPCSSNISVMYDSIGDSEKELIYLKRAIKNQRNKKKIDPIGVDEFEIWAYKNLAVYHVDRKKTWKATVCFFLAYCYGDKSDWPLKLIVPLLLRLKNNK